MSEGLEHRLDPAVVADLYHKHAEDLRAFLAGVLRDREQAAEALQVTFAKVVESGHTAQPETIRAWLFRVAFHEAMNLKRRQDVDNRSSRKIASQNVLPTEANAAHPVDRLVTNEDVERVRQVLTTLPEEQQVVVKMKVYDEKTFAEIATELGLPLGTVLSRMRLALKKLQTRLPQ